MTFGRPNLEKLRATREAEQAAASLARQHRIAHQRPGPTLHTGTYAGSTRAAVPKTKPWRCPALLDMANGRPCLLCPAGRCTCTPGSVVACHSNWHHIGGRAKNRKADDCYTVWGGDRAHEWLDRSGAPAAEKEARFMAAHARQVLAWRIVAVDPAEPERFRRAARAALEHLNATPLGEAP